MTDDQEKERIEIDKARERAELMRQLLTTPYWKELLVPEFKNFIEELEGRALTDDPWKRYAAVEVIFALREFKMRLDEIAEMPKPPQDVDAILANIEDGFPINDLGPVK